MQDRFKFRGKEIDNNQWYYGSYLYLHNPPKYDWNGTKHESKEDVHFIIDEKDMNYRVYPETVGQCTGLKDVNGKLIYEGDIVRDISTQTVYKVSYKKCAFYLENKEYVGYFHELSQCFSISRIEVIGNIYENPELLSEVE